MWPAPHGLYARYSLSWMTVTGHRCICSTTYAKNRPHSSEGVIETSDHVLTAFLLLHLWKATDDLPISADSHTNWPILINRVTPINVSHTDIKRSLTRLKSKEACGQDLVSPKLLKLAGETITPSNIPLLKAACNSVPASCRTANVSALVKKKDNETWTELSTDFPTLHFWQKAHGNCCFLYYYISHICSQSCQPHQLIKKGHSTEVLLVKMNEDQRRALDKNLTVRIVFIHFRQEFDSISHDFLLDKVQTILVFYALSG